MESPYGLARHGPEKGGQDGAKEDGGYVPDQDWLGEKYF